MSESALDRLTGAVIYVDGDDCEGGLLLVEVLQEVAALRNALERARDFIKGPGDRPGPVLRQIEAALEGKA